MIEPIHIISLGAGVQSSTMALMASHGEIEPMPYCAIFADTGDEPDSVYDWLRQLEGWLPFPIVKVSVGKLSLAVLAPRVSKGGGYIKPALPVFFKRGQLKGKGLRHCTADFKITPVLRFANSIRRTGKVVNWMGISLDEAHRMKISKRPWCRNHYPLIDLRMTRADCLRWMEQKGYPRPPRSACIYCPYHSDAEWIRLKTEEPKEFQKAVEFERRYQAAVKQTALDGTPYLHSTCTPLDRVKFETGQGELQFGNECEGMCGV